MAAFSNYLEENLLKLVLMNTAWTQPVSVCVALFTAATTDGVTTGGAGQSEVANSGAYARQAVTFGNYASGQVSNTAAIVFPTATAGWGTVTHIGIFDNTGYGLGNCLFHGPLATPKTINTGDTFQFLAGQLLVGLD